MARPTLAQLKTKPQQASVPKGAAVEDTKQTNADTKFAASGARPQPQTKLVQEVD
jgi:hypothetical protein